MHILLRYIAQLWPYVGKCLLLMPENFNCRVWTWFWQCSMYCVPPSRLFNVMWPTQYTLKVTLYSKHATNIFFDNNLVTYCHEFAFQTFSCALNMQNSRGCNLCTTCKSLGPKRVSCGQLNIQSLQTFSSTWVFPSWSHIQDYAMT